MIFYTLFNIASGEIEITGTAQREQDVVALLSESQGYILEGSSINQYVSNGVVVDMPPKPSDDHAFDYVSKSWIFDSVKVTARVLAKRNELLADGPDRINPIWWASMTQAEQDAWVAYRQALLDITSQPNYPMQVDWPVKPE